MGKSPRSNKVAMMGKKEHKTEEVSPRMQESDHNTEEA